jgi:hypothetical protein
MYVWDWFLCTYVWEWFLCMCGSGSCVHVGVVPMVPVYMWEWFLCVHAGVVPVYMCE